ncbi:MAG: hypothetical protein IKF38_07240 [Clostridia bacterium]|nr:hypothetical protein [Clostridia bacterium]
MAIVTFCSNGKEQTGKTMSIASIATYMAIEHNMKILLISTSIKDSTLQNCFIARPNIKTLSFGMFAPRAGNNSAMQSGMTGLVRMARSNKVTPEMIRNYTRVVFNDALEILYSGESEEITEDITGYYPDIIRAASLYYDLVLIDLDKSINYEIQREIINLSNLVVANLAQKISCIDRFIQERKNDEILASKKTMILIGRYDRYSKFTAKNISRYMGEKKQVLTIPYNTLLYDASEEAGVPDYFLNFVKNPNLDKEDRNYLFFQEIRRAVDSIQYRLQELQAKF